MRKLTESQRISQADRRSAVHAGRSVAFGEGTLTAPDGSLIATGTATMRIYTDG